jgi:hypothetical protein
MASVKLLQYNWSDELSRMIYFLINFRTNTQILEIAENIATIPVNKRPKTVIIGYKIAKNTVHILFFAVAATGFVVLSFN